MAKSATRKIAENYVKKQVRGWDRSEISKRAIQKAITEVATTLQKTRDASVKAKAKKRLSREVGV
jgi:hypothetical protein